MTMKNEIKEIKDRIAQSDEYMYQVLMTVYKYQTEDEKDYYSTSYQNGMGFNMLDAEILTSFAKFFESRGYLTDKQKELARKKLVKYAGQVIGLEMGGVEIKEAPKKEEKFINVTITIKESNKLNGEYSAFVSSDYDRNLVSFLRSLPNRWWHSETKEWEIPTNRIDDVLIQLDTRYKVNIIGKELLEEKKEIKSKEVKLDDYNFKTQPFEHQIEAIKFGLSHNRWLLGDSMGLGKTKVAIDLACIKKQRNGYNHCLIICGVNGLKYNWFNEIKIHSNERGYILGQRGNKIGSTTDKLVDIKNLKNIDEYFIITNVESLRNEEIVKALQVQCNAKEINMIVLDEAHICKNPSSQQGKGVLKISAETMIAMTGTPLMNKPIDLYFILKWLGYEKHSFYSFKNYYCEMGGYGGYEIIGYKHLDELQEQLHSLMLRRLKEDVFDLPEKIYVDEYVELLPKQRQVYNEVTQIIKMNIDKIITSPNPLAELIRMRQATGYTGILSSTINESAKLDRLEELVEEAINNNQKVVIFSNWTQMTNPIINRLNTKYDCAVITGELSTEERQRAMERFQNNSECKVIVGTTGAMGTGITLTAGTVEIFVDEPWNKALKEQAVDRCHRIGTKSNVTIYTLLAKNTIDEKIHDLIEQKGMMSDMLVDGKIIGNKKELLEFLLN